MMTSNRFEDALFCLQTRNPVTVMETLQAHSKILLQEFSDIHKVQSDTALKLMTFHLGKLMGVTNSYTDFDAKQAASYCQEQAILLGESKIKPLF